MLAHATRSAIRNRRDCYSRYLILRDHGCGPNPTSLFSSHRRRATMPSTSLWTDSPRWPTLSHARRRVLQSNWLSYTSDTCGPYMDYHFDTTPIEDCSLLHRTCGTYTGPSALTSDCPWPIIRNRRDRWSPTISGLRRTSRSFPHTDKMIGWIICTRQSSRTIITSTHRYRQPCSTPTTVTTQSTRIVAK
jgi:hypothetical protein